MAKKPDDQIEEAKRAAGAFAAVLAVLDPLKQPQRERVLAAVAVLLGLVPAHVVLNELRCRKAAR